MNNKELILANFIANLVVEKLENKFELLRINEEIDEDNDKLYINDLLNDKYSFKEDEEEKLIGELARLTTLLIMYEEKELYEKAAIIKNKIRIINKKLDND
jgi:hypothetical protein